MNVLLNLAMAVEKGIIRSGANFSNSKNIAKIKNFLKFKVTALVAQNAPRYTLHSAVITNDSKDNYRG